MFIKKSHHDARQTTSSAGTAYRPGLAGGQL